MVRNAWLSDDAFLTFRTTDNFVNGYGLKWNVNERVQAYTHPLWLFLLSLVYSFTHEIYYTAIILSCAISLLAVAVYAYGIAGDWRKALAGISLLCLSKAFMDYTTGGLGNPLSYLLFAIFFVIYYRYKNRDPLFLFFLSFIASLCAVNRLDTILFFIPVLVYEYISLKQWGKGAGFIALGFIPLLCWTGFSFFYYGFPLPNPFYATLHTGINQIALLNQGFVYYLDSVKHDPLAIPVILIGIFSFFFTNDKRTIPASPGIFMYTVYVFITGGGFMSGSFFALPFFCSVLILSFAPVKSFKVIWAPALCLVLFIGLRSPLAPVLSDETYKNEVINDNGIADGRGLNYQETGLLQVLKNKKDMPLDSWIEKGKELKEKGVSVIVQENTALAFFAGPDVHFIDAHALSEPLLARIHIRNPANWKIDYFTRDIPPGYIKTIETGKNMIRDKNLALFYDKLSIVIKEDIFTPGRFREIWNFATGKYNHLLSRYRNEMVNVSIKDIAGPADPGTPWDKEGAYLFPPRGIHISLGRKWNVKLLEMTLAYNQAYEIIYYKSWVKLKKQTIRLQPGFPGKLAFVRVDIPLEITKRGFTGLLIKPVQGNGKYSIGHILLKEEIE